MLIFMENIINIQKTKNVRNNLTTIQPSLPINDVKALIKFEENLTIGSRPAGQRSSRPRNS